MNHITITIKDVVEELRQLHPILNNPFANPDYVFDNLSDVDMEVAFRRIIKEKTGLDVLGLEEIKEDGDTYHIEYTCLALNYTPK